jgi:hypothetical protein
VEVNLPFFNNIGLIGQLLFNHYLYLFIIVSFLLLISMVGSIILTSEVKVNGHDNIETEKEVLFFKKYLVFWVAKK